MVLCDYGTDGVFRGVMMSSLEASRRSSRTVAEELMFAEELMIAEEYFTLPYSWILQQF